MLPVNLHNLSSPLKKKKNKDTASSHVLIVKISHGLRTSAGQGGGAGVQSVASQRKQPPEGNV